MIEDAHADKPGKTVRTLYIASLCLLLAYVGLWIYALLSPMKVRIVYDQLGMTEPDLFTRDFLLLGPVIYVVSAAAPCIAVILLMSGWLVLKRGRRRAMKILLPANCAIILFTALPYWSLKGG